MGPSPTVNIVGTETGDKQKGEKAEILSDDVRSGKVYFLLNLASLDEWKFNIVEASLFSYKRSTLSYFICEGVAVDADRQLPCTELLEFILACDMSSDVFYT